MEVSIKICHEHSQTKMIKNFPWDTDVSIKKKKAKRSPF